MAVTIHPTAIIEKGAELADGVEIGPFCIVSARARLAENVRLVSHVSIAGSTTIGARTTVYPFACLGHPPQDNRYKGEDTQLIIGADNRIRESCVPHVGTIQGRGRTVIGDRCLLMNGSHVGHDGVIGNGVTYATHAVTGGLALVEDLAILGGNSAVHQLSRVGMGAFIGGCAAVVGDVIPFGMVDNHGALHGLNIVGLKRRGATRETIHLLRNVYRELFHGAGYFEDRIAMISEASGHVPEVKRILDFIAAGEKAAALPAEASLMASTRLAIIAGGGDLPRRVAEQARRAGRNPFLVGLKGFVDAALLKEFDGPELSVGELGRLIQLMKHEGCEEMVFAGWLKRPDFASLKLDLKGVQSLPRILAAAKRGDDALLRAVMDVFADAGFRIIGADDALDDLRVGPGRLGAIAPADEHWADIRRAAEVAKISGSLEIGQGAISCGGLILAVEAQEGTDRMLARIPDLVEAIRGTPEARRGVLVKAAKPQQERRIDLPTIGLTTVAGADRAGLAGIAVEAGAALVVDREKVAAAANAAGLFIYGFTAADLA